MESKPVKIYFRPTCGYSQRALQLLESKEGVKLEKIDITDSTDLKEKMVNECGGRSTVPQIFIDGKHVGGCDDIVMLNTAGKLDEKLYK